MYENETNDDIGKDTIDYSKIAPIEPHIQRQWTEIEAAQKAYDVTLSRIVKVQKAIENLNDEEADLYSTLSACKTVVDKLLFPPEPKRSYGGQD